MGAKNITDYLPSKEETALLQAKVSKSLFQKVKERKAQLGYSWEEVVEAMFKKFLEETK